MGLPGRARAVGIFDRGLRELANLRGLLGAEKLTIRPGDSDAMDLDFIAGSPRSPDTEVAQRYAQHHGLPFVRLDDGFLRSAGSDFADAPPLSLILDDRGVHYDATRPSRIESLLASSVSDGPLDDAALIERASQCIARVVAAGLSNTNDSPTELPPLPGAAGRKRVLVVDQTRGDMSVLFGEVPAGGFEAMLQAALAEHPDAQVLVKLDAGVTPKTAKHSGHLAHLADTRIHVIREPVNPIALLQLVDHVYVATSQLGFEALMVGKPVTCFGVPFYAGWGLTDDRVPVSRRGVSRTREQLFAAAYILLARYVDPDTGEPAEVERVIGHLEVQRELFARNTGRLYCFGFNNWKHDFVRSYLRSPGNEVVFVRTAGQAKRKGFCGECKIVVWGARCGEATQTLSEEFGVPVWRMEDGFLRSVGLGSDRTAPASLVVDRSGVYYDPRSPSDLEMILVEAEFSPSELKRAEGLRQTIVTREVSKYNIDGGDVVAVRARPGQRVVLVPGQVADDASVQLGSPEIRTNTDLLRQVRKNRPDAYIIYKPHPDVVSGNRRGVVQPDDVAAYCDDMIVDAGIGRCLAVADELHTMTSLVGFEALMRGKEVVVYGQPFYAGWGLTDDQCPPERRGRKRTLDELVAATLLRYPRYVNHETGEFTRAEYVVNALAEGRPPPGHTSLKRGWPNRYARRFMKGVRTAVRFGFKR